MAGFYVRPRSRGTGVADGLLNELIANLPEGITQLQLTAVANKPRTVGFFEKAGFSIWGTEPRGSRANGDYLDEVHMTKVLD